jgi:hypothetical protein
MRDNQAAENRGIGTRANLTRHHAGSSNSLAKPGTRHNHTRATGRRFTPDCRRRFSSRLSRYIDAFYTSISIFVQSLFWGGPRISRGGLS